MYANHLGLALLSTMIACQPGSTPPDGVGASCLAPTANPVRLAAAPCPIIICGDNAPNAGDGLLFDEVSLAGHANHAGVKIVEVRFGRTGGTATLDIQGDELIVQDATGPHRGTELIGTVIRMVHEPTNEPFELRVACYEDRVAKFLEGEDEFVPVYDFQARRAPFQFDNWFHVCKEEPLVPDPMFTGMPYHAVVYAGDRYDRMKRVIPADPAERWSFIACNGSAGSKMHLHRHTQAGEFDDRGSSVFPTSPDERTTLLKAITADYCGTGMPDFTVPGTHLAFATKRDPGRFPSPWSTLTSVEALWGPGGATCLDTPRLVARDAVVSMCGHSFNTCYPGAMAPPPSWPAMGYAVTANPMP
jgi:hypothetical protein